MDLTSRLSLIMSHKHLLYQIPKRKTFSDSTIPSNVQDLFPPLSGKVSFSSQSFAHRYRTYLTLSFSVLLENGGNLYFIGLWQELKNEAHIKKASIRLLALNDSCYYHFCYHCYSSNTDLLVKSKNGPGSMAHAYNLSTL